MGAAEKRDDAPDELWKAEDAAAFLKLERADIYQMVHNGEIPAWLVLRFGRRLRFDAARFRSWAAEKRVSSLPVSER